MKSTTALDTGILEPARMGATRKSVIVFGAALGMVVGFSAAYFSTLSVFLKPIAGSFGWGRAQTSAVAVLAQLGLALGAPIVGRLIDRYGAHRVIPVSIALFALGLFSLSIAPNSLLLFGALTFVLGLAAVGTTPAGFLTVLPPVFDKRLGTALGLAMFGLGVGNALMPMMAQGWIVEAGWQSAYRYLAATVLIGGVTAVLLLFGPDYAKASGQGGRVATTLSQVGIGLTAAIRTGRFWLIVVLLFTVSTAGLGALVHMVPLLTDRGMSTQQAAKVAGLIGLGVMTGRVATGLLIDVINARLVAAGAFLIGAAGLALIAVEPSASFLIDSIGAFLFAFTLGAEGDFIPFFVRRYFGLKQFSLLYGVLFLVFALGGVAGPVLFGWAFDKLGGYTAALSIAAAACAVSALLVLMLGKYAFNASRTHSRHLSRRTTALGTELSPIDGEPQSRRLAQARADCKLGAQGNPRGNR